MINDQAAKLRDLALKLKTNRKRNRRLLQTVRIAVSSGKGGVGKSNISLNLSLALRKLSKKVLLIDADLNLGNIDLLLGITPEYMLRDVIEQKIPLKSLLVKGPLDLDIMPAASGDLNLLSNSEEVKYKIEKELESLEGDYDFIIVDTGAGIGDDVLGFASNSDKVLIITTPEPTAITDAYALIKVLTVENKVKNFNLVVNMIENRQEGDEVYEKLKIVSEHFLQTKLELLEMIPKDEVIPKAIRNQTPAIILAENCPSSKKIMDLARKINKYYSQLIFDKGKNRGSLFKNMVKR